MDLKRELDLYLRSRFTFICIVSYEEERILEQVHALCEKSKRSLYCWDHADGFQPLCGVQKIPPSAKEPLAALEAISKMTGEIVFLLRDFHHCWKNQSRVTRKLRSLAHKLKFTKKTIIVTTPEANLPRELKDCSVTLNFPPPDVVELNQILERLAATPGITVNLSEEQREQVLNAALGLSANQAQRVFAKAMVTNGRLDAQDISLIASEKKEIVREAGGLEFYSKAVDPDNVGGLDVLKEWLQRRKRAFSQVARDYGLPAPKGIALIGIPGTGKSLTAKMISGAWQIPLLRLDIGALFGSLVGQSEENTRRALALAETVSPCLLWIDEMEKGLSIGGGDGGTSMRVFGTILSWMQEKTKPVFIVATANDISKLPPELLRRGRFDEIFFLDLPTTAERKAIFDVHIRKRKRAVKKFDLNKLAAASKGYVGAEIEQAVIDAMYLAFGDAKKPGREFVTADILKALKNLVPMSISQRV